MSADTNIDTDTEKKIDESGVEPAKTAGSQSETEAPETTPPVSLSADVKTKLTPIAARAQRRMQRRKKRQPNAPGGERQQDYTALLTEITNENPDLKVLVVDDCGPTRLLVRSILGASGVREFIDASDGADALVAIQNNNPDLLISDVQMMPLDGIELSRLIRKNTRLPNPNIPIVMMTGFTEKGRIVELRAAGLTEVVAKPISPSMLCRNVVVALRNQGGGASTGIPDDKI